MRAYVLDLEVTRVGRSAGAETRFSARAPVFTMVLDVVDAETGTAVARLVDRRQAPIRWNVTMTDSAIDPAGVRRQMLRWARTLRKHLDRLAAVG